VTTDMLTISCQATEIKFKIPYLKQNELKLKSLS